MDNFQTRLKYLRAMAGYSMEGIAKEIEVSRQTWYNWETGKNPPNAVHLARLVDLANVSLDWLVMGRGTPPVKRF